MALNGAINKRNRGNWQKLTAFEMAPFTAYKRQMALNGAIALVLLTAIPSCLMVLISAIRMMFLGGTIA